MSIRSERNRALEYEIRRLKRISNPDISLSELNSFIADLYTQFLREQIERIYESQSALREPSIA